MSTQPPTEPLDPILIPDPPQATKRRKRKAPTLAPVALIESGGTKPPAIPPPPSDEPRYTLNEAYEYQQGDDRNTLDLEKALRAAAFLLEWASDIGNDDVDGVLAHGISVVVLKSAERVRRLYTRDDIYRFGGDPTKPQTTEEP